MNTRTVLASLAILLTLMGCQAQQDSGLQPQPPSETSSPSASPTEPGMGEVEYPGVVVVSVSGDTSDLGKVEIPIVVPTEEDAKFLFFDSVGKDKLLAAWQDLALKGTVYVRSVGNGCLPPLSVTAVQGSGLPVVFTEKDNPANDAIICLRSVTHFALVAVPNS